MYKTLALLVSGIEPYLQHPVSLQAEMSITGKYNSSRVECQIQWHY